MKNPNSTHEYSVTHRNSKNIGSSYKTLIFDPQIEQHGFLENTRVRNHPKIRSETLDLKTKIETLKEEYLADETQRGGERDYWGNRNPKIGGPK